MMQFQVIIHGDENGRAGPLAVTFEQAMENLAGLPRLLIEPDGSFVWSQVDARGSAWQVEGNLLDRGLSLAYVELSGVCPESAFNQFVTALGWPTNKLVFQMPRRGEFLGEDAFRRLAASSSGAF